MLAKQVHDALGCGVVEKLFEVLRRLSSKFFAPGEEVALLGSEGGIDVIRIHDDRPGQLRAIIHREVRAFPCER